jgi:hypothetical protein
LYAFLISPTCATCPAHLNLLAFITLIISSTRIPAHTIHTWNMVAAGRSWQTVTSVTLIWPVYIKCNILAIAVGQTPCNLTRDISLSLRPPVNIAWNKRNRSHTTVFKYIAKILAIFLKIKVLI